MRATAFENWVEITMGNTSVYKSAGGAELVETKSRELLRHWPIEKQERILETRHGRTRVFVCGSPDNPPLLLLHPSYSSAVYWIKQVQTYVSSHQVFAIDILGEAGDSDPHRPPHKGLAYAEWMEDIYRELAIDRAALVGASLGAWLCLKFACGWPERVERLAIISPPGIVRAHRAGSIVGSAASALLGPLGRRLTFGSQLKKSDIDPRMRELLQLTQRHMKPRRKQLPRFTDRELAQLYCPVLLIVGGNDAYFNVDKLILRAVKALPQVELIFRHKEGHFLSEFGREVDRFLVTHYAPD